MDFIKIRIVNALGKIDQDYGKTVNEMFNLISPKFSLHQNTWRPYIDIYEDSEEIIILADIAGVNTEDLRIEIDHRTVKLYGIREDKPLVRGARYRVAEIPCGYFERTVNLPVPIDTEQAEAFYKNGLLQLRMAKLPLTKAYKIQIRNI
jgi:HSP20 family protein